MPTPKVSKLPGFLLSSRLKKLAFLNFSSSVGTSFLLRRTGPPVATKPLNYLFFRIFLNPGLRSKRLFGKPLILNHTFIDGFTMNLMTINLPHSKPLLALYVHGGIN